MSTDNVLKGFVPYEPKQKRLFIVKTKEFPDYVIYAAERPSCYCLYDKDDICEVHWTALRIEMFDPIMPSMAQAVYEVLTRNSGRLHDFELHMFGPIGDVVEKWQLLVPRIESVSFSEMSWLAEPPTPKETLKNDLKPQNVATIKLVISYKKAELIF